MSGRDLIVDGKLLSTLRVVDLKEALEKRSLSKSGTKKELADRLRQHLLKYEQSAAEAGNEEELPNISAHEKMAEGNPFLKEYFESQAQQFQSAKKLIEARSTAAPEVSEAPLAPEQASPVRQEIKSANDVTETSDSAENGVRADAEPDVAQLGKAADDVIPEAQISSEKSAVVEEPNLEGRTDREEATKKNEESIDEAKTRTELKEDESNGDVQVPTEQVVEQNVKKSPASVEIEKRLESPESSDKSDKDDERSDTEQISDSGDRSRASSAEPQAEPVESKLKEEPAKESSTDRINIDLEISSEEKKDSDAADQKKSERSQNASDEEEDTRSDGEMNRAEWKRQQGKTDKLRSGKNTVPEMRRSQDEENAPFKIATTSKRASPVPETAMDVEDSLDYGDEESDQKLGNEEFTWSRRILRLKNRCTAVEKRERKWVREDRKPVLVTSQVLQAFFPDVKPLAESEVRLEEKATKVEHRPIEAPSVSMEIGSGNISPPIKRKISIVPLEEMVKELSPPRNPITEVLIITNLTRPFTVPQLKDMLQRTGTVQEIWVDKIKSKCLAKFTAASEAEETRNALHGIRWPASNPKALNVDFSSVAEIDKLLAPEKEHVADKLSDNSKLVREWDIGKREMVVKRSRSRSPARRRRSSSIERKRSRKSSSPSGRRSPHHDARRDSRKEEKHSKALDELFRKTTTTPCLYWLPLTQQQIAEKEELRRRKMLERDRRLAEMGKSRPR